jgi:ATP-dependent RNA helicase DHX57
VLVFMPGAPEIDRLVRQLSSSSALAAAAAAAAAGAGAGAGVGGSGGGGGGGGSVRVLPLHGGLPPGVQSRVFEVPPRGVLKVVVATNVAETSLTIDDVTVVVDTGRHKEMRWGWCTAVLRARCSRWCCLLPCCAGASAH